MFNGSITALITPFTAGGTVDWAAFEKFVEWQINQGVHGVVPCGTTGESPTVTHDEHKEIVKRCVDIADKRVPVIAGTGSNSTAEAIELTQEAKDDGADAALIVAPYYNNPTQDGLFAHFKAIHDAVDIPIILYNVPGRCIADISNETVARLAELKNIVGIKDATADLTRPTWMRNEIGDDFCLLTGEDGSTAAYLAQGGQGAISVSANVAPKLCADMHNAWQAGDIAEFQRLNMLLAPLHDAMFFESSPAPVKYAASRLGLSSDHVRLPLLKASDACRSTVDEAMNFAGLLNKTPQVVNG
jgi:4-hydroxy-tetrahydrodipicolinate synthase